jgi:ABC-type Mn2+/Zn2+ transport system ATPase subunit
MGCVVTFHHRISQDRLTAAMEPQTSEAFHALLESALAETAEAAMGSREVEIELTLCGDEEMTHLNFDHMGERGPTDVLAFPLHEWSVDMGHSHLADDDAGTPPGGLLLGDVVIEADHLEKGFGDTVLIDDLSFKLPRGGIVGVIGPNGAGKTTLFRMIVGQDKPDDGAIRIGDTVKLGYVDQSRDALDGKKSVFEEISGGNDVIKLGAREVPSRAYVGWFNFKGPDQQKKVGQLSGGERNRVHLAKMLKSGANLILLDEPTNDLDVETLSSLEAALEDFPGCAVIISHDRFFLDRIATHILSFEGDSHVEWFEGNFEDYEKDKKRRLGEDAVLPKRIKYKKFARG